jgi:hypothetical protein
MTAGLSWNLIDDIRQLLSFHFMLNARGCCVVRGEGRRGR